MDNNKSSETRLADLGGQKGNVDQDGSPKKTPQDFDEESDNGVLQRGEGVVVRSPEGSLPGSTGREGPNQEPVGFAGNLQGGGDSSRSRGQYLLASPTDDPRSRAGVGMAGTERSHLAPLMASGPGEEEGESAEGKSRHDDHPEGQGEEEQADSSSASPKSAPKLSTRSGVSRGKALSSCPHTHGWTGMDRTRPVRT